MTAFSHTLIVLHVILFSIKSEYYEMCDSQLPLAMHNYSQDDRIII
jgi:hypothetical protein